MAPAPAPVKTCGSGHSDCGSPALPLTQWHSQEFSMGGEGVYGWTLFAIFQ